MAFTQPIYPTNNNQTQPDQPTISAAAFKLLLDQVGIDTQNYLIGLLSELEASTSAGNLGYDDLTYGPTIKTALDLIISAGSGSIPPDGSITKPKLADDVLALLVGWVRPVTDNTLRIDELAVNAGIASITGPNSEVYYDYVGSSKAFTAGTIDRTKAYCETVTTSTDNVAVTSMIDGVIGDFVVGQEITLQDATSKEDLIILSIADPTITFTTNIVNTYASGANVYRSNLTDDWEFGGFGADVGWDVNGATYNGKSFSVATEGSDPTGVFFKPDGTKMYVLIGSTVDSIFQYTLSTPFDVTTATYDSKLFDIGTEAITPAELFFKEDGLIMYAVDSNLKNVYQYALSTAWDVSTASYGTVLFNVNSEETQPKGLFISPDGTKMYTVGGTSNTVFQYTLATPWLISSASYASKSFSVVGQENQSTGLFFKSDGLKMYVIGTGSDTVYEYDLGTLWDVSTASYNSISFSVASEELLPNGLCFAPDGKNMYITAFNSIEGIFQYSTGIPDTEITDVDIRVNIESFTDKTEISAFLETNDFDTVTLDGSLSIRATGTDEVYVDTTDVKIDEGTNNMYLSTGTVVTAEQLATMKYQLTRASTGDAVKINRVQGGLL